MATPTVDYSKLSKDELYALLCPPAPQVSEQDIKLARARYVMDQLIYDMMSMTEGLRVLADQVEAFKQGSAQPEGEAAEKIERKIKIAQSVADYFNTQLENDVNDDAEPWDAFASHFDKYHLDGLTSMHGGDCTAIACTCERCYAEHLFNLPSSASWRGKAEGARIYGAYSRAVAAEKKALADSQQDDKSAE